MSPKDVRKFDPFVPFGVRLRRAGHQGFRLRGHRGQLAAHRRRHRRGHRRPRRPSKRTRRSGSRRSRRARFRRSSSPAASSMRRPGRSRSTYGLRGPNLALVTACTTSTHSIGIAAALIQYGDADVMIAGGAEMAFTPLGVGSFCQARALSLRNDEPERASRPWDRDRDGFVMAEGGGADRARGVRAREGARRADLRGAHRLRHERRRPPHHGAAGRRRGRAPRDGRTRSAMRSSTPTHVRLHQCARDLDRTRRSRRDDRDQARVRRPRAQGRGELDQVDDRAPARRGGRRRGDLLDPRDPRRRRCRRRSTSRIPIRSATSTTCRARRARRRSRWRCRTRSVSAARTAAWSSARSPEWARRQRLRDADLLALHERFPDRYPVLLESVSGAAPLGRQHDLLLALPGARLVQQPDGAPDRRRAGSGAPAAGSSTRSTAGMPANASRVATAAASGARRSADGWFLYLGYELARRDRTDAASAARHACRAPWRGACTARCCATGARAHETRMRRARRRADLDADFAHRSVPTSTSRARRRQRVAAGSALRDGGPGTGRADVSRRRASTCSTPSAAATSTRPTCRAPGVPAWRRTRTVADLYRALRTANPAPFAALAQCGDFAVLSSSPERLLQVQRRHRKHPADCRHAAARARRCAADAALMTRTAPERKGARRARDAGRSRTQRPGPHLPGRHGARSTSS